jgi:hypothetical protein
MHHLDYTVATNMMLVSARYSEVSRLVHDLALGFRTGRVSVSLSFCLLSLGFTAAGASEQRTLGIADPNR